MKYIVVQFELNNTIFEYPFIFPKNLVHSEMSKYCQSIIRRHFKKADSIHPVSAGFYNPGNKSECFGESETLKISSRSTDVQLIENMDYFYGLVEV